MNIYLIHGDNNIASYERLQQYLDKARREGWEITYVENSDQNITDTLRSNSLFNVKRLVVIRKYSLIDNKTLDYLKNIKDELELIVFHDNTIPVTFIKKLPPLKKNEVFKLSKYLWKFIDSFYPGNIRNCLFNLHESIKTDPIELIFFLLIGQLKDIFLVLYSNSPLPYPQWRLSNIKKQADKFGKEKIKMTIDALSSIDIKVKTTSANLKDELDLFIVRKLE